MQKPPFSKSKYSIPIQVPFRRPSWEHWASSENKSLRWPLIGLAAFLALYNNLINLLPTDLHDILYVPLNLAVAGGLVLLALSLGISWADLGLARHALIPGAKWGLGTGIVLVSPLFLALVLPDPFSSLIEDARLQDTTLSELQYRALFRIPLGTALFEEVAFRGVLFGVLRHIYNLRAAVLGSSILFGIWHIVPTLNTLEENDALGTLVILGVLGGVGATFLGGLFFAWLRCKSGGIYGPILAHWSINSLSATAAFVALQ